MTVGTSGNDNLQNDPSVDPELVDALEGNDQIIVTVPARAGGSTITVDGGDGFDVVEVEADSFASGPGSNSLVAYATDPDFYANISYGGVERLILTGRLAVGSTFSTGSAEDWLRLDAGGAFEIFTNAGDDRIVITSGNPNGLLVDAGSGNDLIDLRDAGPTSGTGGGYLARGGDGEDRIIGRTGFADVLEGGDGDDYFVADTVKSATSTGDSMYGGLGNDRYEISRGDEHVGEEPGEGVDTVIINLVGSASSLSYTLPANVENMTDVTIAGGYNVFTGNAGNNVLIDLDDRARTFRVHDGGIDRVESGGGDDRIYFGASLSASDRVIAGAGIDRLILQGTQAVQIGAGHLDGVEQLQLLAATDDSYQNAGGGFATYRLTVADAALSGQVLIVTGASLRAGEHVLFDARAETDGAFQIFTGAGNDTLYGGAQADLLDGGLGSDQLFGGGGNDIYHVDGSDAVYEAAGQGTDSVLAATSFSLGAGASIELLATIDPVAAAAINLYGNGLAQRIVGNAGNNGLYGLAGNDRLEGLAGIDYLDGGAGNDVMTGGIGGDIYRVDSALDVLIETAGEGRDSIYTSVSYALKAGVEIELFGTNDATATTNIELTGNEFAQQIVGNAGHNILRGGGGADYLLGLAGTDTLDGGAGSDIMEGGADNDRYYVNSTGDQVREADGEGHDTVYSSVSYSLTDAVRVEVIATTDSLGTAALTLGGNAHANTVIGNAGANALYGFGGADYLLGLEGSDRLDGGTGADIMDGGKGDDRYYVDNAGDIVRELAYLETDTDIVYTSVTYGLRYEAEVEVLATRNAAGTEALTLVGSQYANGLIGNAGDNALYGLEGSDTLLGLAGNDVLDGGYNDDLMEGGAGDDLYFVENRFDQVHETAGEGYDHVYSSVSYILAEGEEIEVLGTRDAAGTRDLSFTGNSGSNQLIGNAGANVLQGLGGVDYLLGLDGHDILDGGAGQDLLTGGGGIDTFGFSAVSDTGIGAAADRITDFVSGTEYIHVWKIDADTTTEGDQGFTFVGTAAFSGHAGELRYDQSGGEIYVSGDVDGDAVTDFQIIVVSSAIGQSDFVL